jgi:hypothetical protein
MPGRHRLLSCGSIPDDLETLVGECCSVCEGLCAEFGLRDKSSGLMVDRLQRPTVDLIMVGNGEGLGLTGNDTPHFDVTAALREFLKSESAEDLQNLTTRQGVWASDNSFKFHGRQNRRVTGKTEGGQVFTIEVQPNRFRDIECQLIQRGSLCNYRQIQTFGNKQTISSADAYLNCSSHY